MKSKSILISSLLLLALASGRLSAAPMGTAFTYQGHLNQGGILANGTYDLQFSIYEAVSGGSPVAGPVTNGAVGVAEGSFTVALDFGAGVFNGDARWLQIGVRTNSPVAAGFTLLSPRQPLRPTPLAIWSAQAGGVGTGVITASAIASNAITSEKIADGAITLADLGQNGATEGQILKWNAGQTRWAVAEDAGSRAWPGYTENGAFAAPPVASGQNAIAQGEHAQALGNNSIVGGGLDNLANHWFTTVGGGWSNTASGFLFGRTTVAGGEMNRALGDWATVGGGQLNVAGGALFGRATVAGGWQNEANGDMSTISGGSQNSAAVGHASIGGGQYNVISNGAWSVIGGGYSNRAVGMASSVPGGAHNEAVGASAFAAGRRAKALHAGSFVWADSSSDTDFASLADQQFAVRAVGGMYFSTPEISLWDTLGGTHGWGASLRFGDGDYAYVREEADDYLRLHARQGTRLTGGNVGIGTAAPAADRLDVDGGNIRVRGAGGFDAPGEEATVVLGDANHYIKAIYGGGVRIGTWPVGDALCISEQGGGSVGIGTTNPAAKLTVQGNILVQSAATGASVVELGEGLDYAEGFDISDGTAVGPGCVLVIDAAHPGQLKRSDMAYDRKVAGIVAGANGLRSAVRLGVGQFDHDVALAGRVYCNVDTTYGAVEPGDLLTTSPTPGRAMVVKDHQRSQGAILGKAMEALPADRQGQVLVLVTLQ